MDLYCIHMYMHNHVHVRLLLSYSYFTSSDPHPDTLFKHTVSDRSSGSIYGIYIYSDNLSDIFLAHTIEYFWPPLHPKLAIWSSGSGVAHCIRSWQYGEGEGEEGEQGVGRM